MLVDKKDAAINLCECKFYESNFQISPKYAQDIKLRKALFAQENKKTPLNTFIANEDIIENEHALDVVDAFVHIKELM